MAGVSDIVVQLQRQILDYTNYLHNEAYLDGEFKNLQRLQQDLNHPNLVVETVSEFFENFQRTVLDITTALNQQLVDHKSVEILAYRLNGASCSIGAQRLYRACIVFLEHCEQRNIEGCFNSLQQMQSEFFLVKNKLETLFQLENQLVAAGGSIPRQ